MGYATCLGACYGCKRVFSFNPLKVPSLTINGTREPFCKACIDHANVIRSRNGMPKLEIHPQAYEACDDSELDNG